MSGGIQGYWIILRNSCQYNTSFPLGAIYKVPPGNVTVVDPPFPHVSAKINSSVCIWLPPPPFDADVLYG